MTHIAPSELRRVIHSGRAVLLLVFAASALLSGCGEALSDPTITAVLPQRGVVGAEVDILGDRFQGSSRFVSFGGVQASIWLGEAGRVRVQVPEGPLGQTLVVVTIDGRPSNAISFLVE